MMMQIRAAWHGLFGPDGSQQVAAGRSELPTFSATATIVGLGIASRTTSQLVPGAGLDVQGLA
jgi:hypothetical protein